MRIMSFAATTEQFLDGTKNVTRRLGWRTLKPGDLFEAVAISPRVGRGRLTIGCGIILTVRREPLARIEAADVAREGFPDLTPDEFIEMFCGLNRGVEPDSFVTRISFLRIQGDFTR